MENLESIMQQVQIASIVLSVLYIIAMWKLFEKAGQPGWAAIIPIYNLIVLLQISGKPVWWIILCLIPIVNIVVLIMIIHAFSKAYGQGVGMTLGLIFLGFIFMPYMAFSGSVQYVGTGGSTE
ncbi:MAG: DUF5684 domain-containing protein [Cyclobacteriaceae bacterium]|nr:DUF5684 domain-containing protein [Cyclobacteriaceae bacterium]